MILESLCKYYDLLEKEDVCDLPKEGYSIGKISFALIISKNGELKGIMDLREEKGKKIVPKEMLIPEQSGRSGRNAPAYFLSDNAKYVLGIGDDKNLTTFNRFKELHNRYLDDNSPLVKFINNWNPKEAFYNPHIKKYEEEFNDNPNLIFKVEGQSGYIHDDEKIVNAWYYDLANEEDDLIMQCLVTGENAKIARIHTPIKGIKGAHTAGASIVSFNNDSFCSYGKKSSYNAPVSEKAMFKYTTVLNYMLRNPKYYFFVGDTTVLFWAEKIGIYEDLLSELLNPSKAESNKKVEKIDTQTRDLARDIVVRYSMGLSLQQEKYDLDVGTNVHILGISPNNARLSIDFYEVNTFEYFVKRLTDHYNNMQIVGSNDLIPVQTILKETIPKKRLEKKGKGEKIKISPLIGKSLMNSIFTGNLYPMSLYNAIIGRIRADKDINYKRAAIIKACLIRKYKLYKNKEGISVSLNENSTSTPYQLGRLFAVLEKAQKEALGITTIKDKYFTSASATPASVFPVMMKLSLHHTAKAEYGISLENRKVEILSKVDEFPKHLSLDQQGEFILGYYHQVQAFYVKKEEKGEDKQ